MDIRTRLVFAQVSAALGSMLALGAFSQGAMGELLQRIALREFESARETGATDPSER